MEPLARRTVLQVATLAAACGAGGLWPGRDQALATEVAGNGPLPLMPVSGFLAAWVSLDLASGARIQLACPDGTDGLPRIVGTSFVSLSRLSTAPFQEAAGAASRFAVEMAARSWDVNADTCRLEPNRIVHAPSHRSVACATWMEVI